MHYNRLYNTEGEYQGESFNRSLYKRGGSEWDSVEEGSFSMEDSSGNVVSSGSLSKSGDNLHFLLSVPGEDTTALTGRHKLVVRVTRTDDATFNDVIAEYNITYSETKGA